MVGVLAALGLLCVVIGSKGFIILRFGTDLPYWDQWAKEGEMILAPFVEGTLRLKDFFIPHNEHRIAPTLALNLTLAVAGGQWDARVQCVANAFLHAFLMLGIFAFAWHFCGRWWALATGFLLAVLCTLPIVWENTLGGFQSQFYFLIGFSLAATHGLLAKRGPACGRWWIGLLCAGLASVSMGSGFLCLFPVALIVALRSRDRRFTWADALTFTISILLLLGGWLLRAKVPWHEPLHAQNAADFFLFMVRCLAWPRPQWPWLAALIWLPWIVFAVRFLVRRRPVRDERCEMIAAGGLWVLLQAGVLAYARGTRLPGSGVVMPPSRYGDVLAIGIAVNLLAFSIWKNQKQRTGLAGIWAALVIGLGVITALPIWQNDLPALAAHYRGCEKNVRGYVLTGHKPYLEAADQAFPIADWLQRILDRPAIRALLPASVREPLKIAAAESPGDVGFEFRKAPLPTPPLENRQYWSSYATIRPAQWHSLPIVKTGFRIWRFEMAGQTSDPGNGLELKFSGDGSVSPRILPTREPNDSWRSAYVILPREPGETIVQARSETPDRWLAFTGPVEISILSEAARLFVHQGALIWGFGVGLLFLAAVAEILGGGSFTSADRTALWPRRRSK